MTVPRSVSDVLKDHVVLEVECIDRMYLNVYVPQLQWACGVASFLRYHRGHRFASSALMAPITKAFVRSIERFVEEHDVPMIPFEKGQRKDDIAQDHLSRFPHDEGVVFVGKAQEKAPVFRTEKRRDPNGMTYPWIVRSTAMINHYYLYCLDEDFGPFFLKFGSGFPYTAKLCINGHEYLKRQLDKAGISYEALDNGVLACKNLDELQKISNSLTPAKIDRLLRKHYAQLLGLSTSDITPGRMTYQLRRLRLHGLIIRQRGTHRYHVTDFGFRIALFFARTHARLLRPGLAHLTDTASSQHPVARAFDALNRQIDAFIQQQQLAS
jgi:hypothetical protein